MKTTIITTFDYEGQPKSTITHETDAVTLDEILQSVEDHLNGCGFKIDGRLDIVEDDSD